MRNVYCINYQPMTLHSSGDQPITFDSSVGRIPGYAAYVHIPERKHPLFSDGEAEFSRNGTSSPVIFFRTPLSCYPVRH